MAKIVFDNAGTAVSLLLFIISSSMIIYILLDIIFGFSLFFSLKKCFLYSKKKEYKELLKDPFEEVKHKFNRKSVKLYIKISNNINAFAVGSFRKNAIVITTGMISHYLKLSESKQGFLIAIRSIMGHEMSHLVNRDFMPSSLIIINQKITNLISGWLETLFRILIRILTVTRINSIWIEEWMLFIYKITNRMLLCFNNFIVDNVYKFIRNFISRNIEYRCDRQSAKAFGGDDMAYALSFLGKSGYFTLFSTHPATQARIKRVQKIRAKDGVILPCFFNVIANYFSLLILLLICLYFGKISGVYPVIERLLTIIN